MSPTSLSWLSATSSRRKTGPFSTWLLGSARQDDRLPDEGDLVVAPAVAGGREEGEPLAPEAEELGKGEGEALGMPDRDGRLDAVDVAVEVGGDDVAPLLLQHVQGAAGGDPG